MGPLIYSMILITLSLRILTNLTSNTNPNIPSTTLFHFLLLLSTIRDLSYPNDEDESNPNLNFINTFIQLLIWYLAFAIIRSGFKCLSASGAIDPQEIAPCTIILRPLANTNASKFWAIAESLWFCLLDTAHASS